MFSRILTISVIFLLLSQAYVMAAVIRSSSNSTSCGDGDTRCCKEVRKIQERRKTPMLTYIAKGFV
jgi:hypothetical protein